MLRLQLWLLLGPWSISCRRMLFLWTVIQRVLHRIVCSPSTFLRNLTSFVLKIGSRVTLLRWTLPYQFLSAHLSQVVILAHWSVVELNVRVIYSIVYDLSIAVLRHVVRPSYKLIIESGVQVALILNLWAIKMIVYRGRSVLRERLLLEDVGGHLIMTLLQGLVEQTHRRLIQLVLRVGFKRELVVFKQRVLELKLVWVSGGILLHVQTLNCWRIIVQAVRIDALGNLLLGLILLLILTRRRLDSTPCHLLLCSCYSLTGTISD